MDDSKEQAEYYRRRVESIRSVTALSLVTVLSLLLAVLAIRLAVNLF